MGRALYAKSPSEQQLAALGLKPGDFDGDIVEIWPENLAALDMFRRVGTRWVTGMSGVVGLRWEAIYPLIDRLGLDGPAWDQLVEDMEMIERGALEEINRKDD